MHLSRLGVVCGMLVVGSTLDRARSFAESVALVDRVGEGETLSGEVRESSAGRRWSVCVYDVTDFEPRALERAWWADDPALRAHQHERGFGSVAESRAIADLRRIVTRACEGEHRSHVAGDGEDWGSPRVAAIRRAIVVRGLADTQRTVAELLGAIRECRRTGADVAGEIKLPTVWQTARVFVLPASSLLEAPRDPERADPALEPILSAMRRASDGPASDAMIVGSTLVTFGSAEAQAAAAEEIRRMREAAAPRAGGSS